MLLKYYYMKIPCFSGVEHTVKNYVYFFKTLFKKVVFFGLLRLPIMMLPRYKIKDTRNFI